jgi:hypothetical protein
VVARSAGEVPECPARVRFFSTTWTGSTTLWGGDFNQELRDLTPERQGAHYRLAGTVAGIERVRAAFERFGLRPLTENSEHLYPEAPTIDHLAVSQPLAAGEAAVHRPALRERHVAWRPRRLRRRHQALSRPGPKLRIRPPRTRQRAPLHQTESGQRPSARRRVRWLTTDHAGTRRGGDAHDGGLAKVIAVTEPLIVVDVIESWTPRSWARRPCSA